MNIFDTSNDTVYWVWLTLRAGIASTLPTRLLAAFNNDIKGIYDADAEQLETVKLTSAQRNRLLDKSTDEAEKIIAWCNEYHVNILCYDDYDFPKRLRNLPDSPMVLYYIGHMYRIDAMLCLAGVGTRSMTKYGYDTAYTFCHDLARSGAVIVSGMAAGIDTTCHRATLDAGGNTIAVLGCPINKVYPASNREIMKEIARKGLLITEYHPFAQTKPANFPQRNRIISGLCQGTIVFEADIGSGSLITAGLARKQGRQVYALPGKIGDANSLGTNELIRDGAKLVTRASDIIEEYVFLYPNQLKSNMTFDYTPAKKIFDSFVKSVREGKYRKKENEPADPCEKIPLDTDSLDPLQVKIYEFMSFEKDSHFDDFSELSDSFNDLMSALTILELFGYIEQKPGNIYSKQAKKL